MSKVGLLTFYESNNYGTCLQAWALSNYISNQGFDCEILNFNRKTVGNSGGAFSVLKNLGPLKVAEIVLTKPYINRRSAKFQKFRNTLHLSENEYVSLHGLKSAGGMYDCFVCGSDMVWSWESQSFLDVYFLKFAPEGKRVSYAPSFGNTLLSEEMKEYYRNSVKNIDYLSCRESSGVKLVEELSGRQCTEVLDPTFLFNADQWRKEFSLKEKEEKGKNVLCYLFGGMNKEFKKNLEAVLNDDENIRYIPGILNEYKSEEKYGSDACGPEEFLQ